MSNEYELKENTNCFLYNIKTGEKVLDLYPISLEREAKRKTEKESLSYPVVPEPSVEQLGRWCETGVSKSTDGCIVEINNWCKHGHPSWFVYYCLVYETEVTIEPLTEKEVESLSNTRKSQYPIPTVSEPSFEELEEWAMDSVCQATDGCLVEHDGHCPHGHPSWMLYYSLI